MSLEQKIETLTSAINALSVNLETARGLYVANLETTDLEHIENIAVDDIVITDVVEEVIIDEVVEEIAVPNNVDSTMVTTFEALPEHNLRPYPRTTTKRRRGVPETSLEKILANTDSTEDEKVEANRVMVEYMIGISNRSIKRLNNIETTSVAEANDKAEAIRLDEIELDHWKSLLGEVDTTASASPAPAPAPSPAPAPAPAPSPAPVADTRGCPPGYMLTDKAPSEYVYESYNQSGWNDEQLIKDGLMVAVSTSVTIDTLREVMKMLSATKPTESLTACIAKYGKRLEEVAVEDYPALLADLNAV